MTQTGGKHLRNKVWCLPTELLACNTSMMYKAHQSTWWLQFHSTLAPMEHLESTVPMKHKLRDMIYTHTKKLLRNEGKILKHWKKKKRQEGKWCFLTTILLWEHVQKHNWVSKLSLFDFFSHLWASPSNMKQFKQLCWAACESALMPSCLPLWSMQRKKHGRSNSKSRSWSCSK